MKSHSPVKYNDWNKINILGEEIAERKEELLDLLNIEYKSGRHKIHGPCPVHGGDKFNAWNWYEGGRWACRTHNCQNEFKASSIGFLRGLLSNLKCEWSAPGDRKYGWDQTIEFALSFLNRKYDKIDVDMEAVERRQFTKQMDLIANKSKSAISNITREQIRPSLEIPSTYYIGRNYLAGTLDKYDVGYCPAKSKQMSWRIVVPVYDDKDNFVGCTGRSSFPECPLCKLYHSPEYACPLEQYKSRYTKWKHSDGFVREDYVYNLNFAKQYIEKSKIIIIVESPGNVWRLEEAGIHNSVACFGAALTDGQKSLLDSLGALAMIVIGDNDAGGEALCSDVVSKCSRTYKLYFPKFGIVSDLGDMTTKDVVEQVKPKIDEIQCFF